MSNWLTRAQRDDAALRPMTKALKILGVSTEIDHQTLEKALKMRRQETLRDLQQRLRDAREEWTWTGEVRDTADSSELDGREDIELELIRMKADLLHRIDEALLRIHHGTYGHCIACRQRISKQRLRALPFAARCKECEETRERTPASVVEMRGWRPRLEEC